MRRRKLIVIIGVIAVLAIGATLALVFAKKKAMIAPATQVGSATTPQGESIETRVGGRLELEREYASGRTVEVVHYVLLVNDTPTRYLRYIITIDINATNVQPTVYVTVALLFHSDILTEDVVLAERSYQLTLTNGRAYVEDEIYAATGLQFALDVFGGFTSDWNRTSGYFYTRVAVTAYGALTGARLVAPIEQAGIVKVFLAWTVERVRISYAIALATIAALAVVVAPVIIAWRQGKSKRKVLRWYP